MTNTTPLVSIIIPVYNVEAYIHECIDSVLNQAYTNLEIILVDDGSPDRCGAICDEYALSDQRIRVVHKTNGGLSDARNAGLDICSGEYIAFVDSDDAVHPDFITILLENMLTCGASLSVCGSTEEKGFASAMASSRTVHYASYADFVLDDSIEDWKIEVWRKLYHRLIWESLRFPVNKKCEDTFVFPQVVYNQEIVYTNRKLYYYRRNPEGITATINDKFASDLIEAFRAGIHFFEKKNLLCAKKYREYAVRCYMYYYLNTASFNRLLGKELLKNMFYIMRKYPIRKTCAVIFRFIKE